MFLKWLPWRFLASRLAKAHGLLDPASLMARIERLAQPSEIAAPMELIRAGAVMHARGLINTKVIQQNLDWVWPYWVQRQFDPADESFLPRAFSLTHLNLTHRNWTAVGLPGCRAYPLVDPRGLLTPWFDGWSIDAWIVADGDERQADSLLPSRSRVAEQWLVLDDNALAVRTDVSQGARRLQTRVWVEPDGERPVCRLRVEAWADEPAWLAVALRPFNPEGVSFIHAIGYDEQAQAWEINEQAAVTLSEPPQRHVTSTYPEGDVFDRLLQRDDGCRAADEVGLASGAALYELPRGQSRRVEAAIDLTGDRKAAPVRPLGLTQSWAEALAPAAALDSGDSRWDFLYQAALRTLILLSPQDVYPGPFTYRRFWFRDAVVILHAMLAAGLTDRVERAIEQFLPRQTVTGFFHSQEGEWDSNGQVLWLLGQFHRVCGWTPDEPWRRGIAKAVHWIARKRLRRPADALHVGLLPAGFSAEHLGNNDYYYWDDFWALAGLREAAGLLRAVDDTAGADEADREADDLDRAIEASLERSQGIRRHEGLPASPYRRMDAGAVGSLAVSFPLQLWPADDIRPLRTAEFLLDCCTVDSAFFQQMIHSGQNAYLTLHAAQVLLRAGDGRWQGLVDAVSRLATSTGQWPEAIHPRTGGGCMGDGQHAWAAAEWVLMMARLFARAEGDRLVLLPGIARLLRSGRDVRMGPLHTRFGTLEVGLKQHRRQWQAWWKADWTDKPSAMAVVLPDGGALEIEQHGDNGYVTIPAPAGAESGS